MLFPIGADVWRVTRLLTCFPNPQLTSAAVGLIGSDRQPALPQPYLLLPTVNECLSGYSSGLLSPKHCGKELRRQPFGTRRGGDTTPGLLWRCPNPIAAPGAAHSSSRTQKTSGKEGKRHRTTAGHPAGEGGGTHPSIHPSGSERSSRRAGRAGRASASPISFVIRSQHARFYI